MAWWALWKLEPWLVLRRKIVDDNDVDVWKEPVDDEEAEEDDEGHGEEDGAVVNILTQSKLSDQLSSQNYHCESELVLSSQLVQM